jgi:hypothetical protein
MKTPLKALEDRRMAKLCRAEGHRWANWLRPQQPFDILIHEYHVCERCGVREDRTRV